MRPDEYNAIQLERGNVEPEILTQLVRQWQLCFDLKVDGKLGPDTWASIKGNSLGTRIALRALAIAVSELGRGETVANNRSNYIDMLRKTDGTGGPWMGVRGAWCATAVSSWIRRAMMEQGVQYAIPFTPSRGARRLGKNMADENYVVDVPEPGAVGIYSRGPVGGWKGHAVLFESYDPFTDTAVTIEGNKGPFPAKVQRFTYPEGAWRRRLLGIYTLG